MNRIVSVLKLEVGVERGGGLIHEQSYSSLNTYKLCKGSSALNLHLEIIHTVQHSVIFCTVYFVVSLYTQTCTYSVQHWTQDDFLWFFEVLVFVLKSNLHKFSFVYFIFSNLLVLRLLLKLIRVEFFSGGLLGKTVLRAFQKLRQLLALSSVNVTIRPLVFRGGSVVNPDRLLRIFKIFMMQIRILFYTRTFWRYMFISLIKVIWHAKKKLFMIFTLFTWISFY